MAILDAVPKVCPQVDAMITAVPGVYPAIKTADCVPILLVDRVRRVSAAVHAGWRGTVKRITRKVVLLMKDRFKSRAQDIVAAVGPAIRGCCYEVDDTVLVPFCQSLPDGERFIVNRPKTGVWRRKADSRSCCHESGRIVASRNPEREHPRRGAVHVLFTGASVFPQERRKPVGTPYVRGRIQGVGGVRTGSRIRLPQMDQDLLISFRAFDRA